MLSLNTVRGHWERAASRPLWGRSWGQRHMCYYKLQTRTTVPNYKQHTCAGLFCFIISITFSFLGDFWIPKVTNVCLVVAMTELRLLHRFPIYGLSFSISKLCKLRWNKGSQYGIWGVSHKDCHQEEEYLLTCRLQLRHGHLMPNKDMLYSTWNSTQYSVMICMGKESK